MTLLEAKRRGPLRIVRIPDERTRSQCTRIGMHEGATVDSAEVLGGGPVLVRRRNQEICVGRQLAGSILVEPLAGDSCGPACPLAAVPVECGRRHRRFGRRT